ncbi:glycosyltransferase family 39 protein [Candidatus Kaiserbacteria bacterium]|nr:glycosyltransferase family 39 protein [Candidatus Kaiserbacteria bacterium]
MKSSIAIKTNAQAAPWRVAFERSPGLVLAVIAIVPILAARYFIGESLRLDEAQSLWQVSRDIRGVLVIVAGDVHVPLYHLLLHGWLSLFGNSLTAARILSLLFFLLSIPFVYLLGKRAYSSTTGLLAAAFFAFSPFMNWYASEVRMYTLFAFLTIVNQYFFLRILEEARPRLGTWAGYALSAVLGVFSHYFFFLNLLAQGAFFLLRRKAFPPRTALRFSLVASFIAIAFAPWAWYVRLRGVAGFQEPILLPPSTVDLFNAFSQFLFGFQTDVINTVFLSLWPLAVVLGIVALRHYRRFLPQTEFLIAAVLIPFGVAFIGSRFITPIFVSRYLVFTLPAFYLLLLRLLSLYPRRFQIFAQVSLAALMLLAIGIQVTNARIPVKEQYASAVSYVTAHATAQDIVLVSAPFTIYPVQYYYRGPAPVRTLPAWNQYEFGPIPAFSPDALSAEVTGLTQDYQNVYLLLSYDQGYEEVIKRYFDSNYERLSAQNFSGSLNLYVYRLRYNTNASVISTPL